MHPRLRIFFVIFSLVYFTVPMAKLFASGLAFSVSPMISDLTIAPGTTQTGLIALSDGAPAGSKPIDVKVSVKDWTLDQNGQAIYSDPGTEPDSCAGWMQISPTEVSLPGGPPVLVRYTIKVPADAQGCYHCIAFFTTAPVPSTVNGAKANICAMIGNTIYVQVGPVVHRAKIASLSMTANNVTLGVENTGSSYIRLGGEIKISDPTGKLVQDVPIPADAVLPGTAGTRLVPIKLASQLPDGAYTITALLDYGGDALLGARVNATLP